MLSFIDMNRREFATLLAGSIVAPGMLRTEETKGAPKTAFYSAVGGKLTLYNIDFEAFTLTKHSTVSIPLNIQYAWPHPSRKYLYVVSSSGGPGVAGDRNFAHAFRIDGATGALLMHGQPQSLPSRPIHTSVDIKGEYLF